MAPVDIFIVLSIFSNYKMSPKVFFHCLLFIQDEKKESGSVAVLDPPPRRHRLRHLRRLRLRLRHPQPPLHRVHHSRPAAVALALAVVVSVKSLKSSAANLFV